MGNAPRAAVRRAKKLVATAAAFFAAAALAAVDVNLASQAELESVKGIGPSLSSLIISERRNGPFTSWDDFRTRVRGVGDAGAARFSKAGLTVNGKAYREP